MICSRKNLFSVFLLLFVSHFCFSSFSVAHTHTEHPDMIKFPPLHFKPPEPDRFYLSNGIQVFFLADRELPLISITAVVRGGSIYDPPGKEGLASLNATLMRTGGTRAMTSREVDDFLDTTGTVLEVAAGAEATSLSLTVLKEHLAPALRVFTDILLDPAYEEKKLELARAIKISRIKRILDDPDRLAFREFHRLLYRGTLRGRQPGIGTVKSISRDDLISFHQRFFRPANTMIAVSGDITKGELIDLLERYLKDWTAPDKVPPETIPPLKKVRKPALIHHLEKDTPQAVIVAGWVAPPQDMEKYFPFRIADFILGSGGFRSRIFSQVRSDRGLAYSTGSVYRARREYGIFIIYAITANETAGQTLSLLKDIINRFRQGDLTASDLDWAKRAINNAFIFSFVSSHQIVHSQLMRDFNGLPEDHLLRYRERINGVQAKEVLALAQDYLAWDNAVILTLGRQKDFDRPLADFGVVQPHQAVID